MHIYLPIINFANRIRIDTCFIKLIRFYYLIRMICNRARIYLNKTKKNMCVRFTLFATFRFLKNKKLKKKKYSTSYIFYLIYSKSFLE